MLRIQYTVYRNVICVKLGVFCVEMENGIAERFDIVLGSDSEGCAMKPAPDSLLRAAALLDVPVSEILYAGDDPRDIEAAHRAGMPAAACRWGYWSVSPDECCADIVAAHPSELVDWALKA